jgi:ribosomal protein S11
MKSLLIVVFSASALLQSLPALAGKSQFDIWQQEKFAAQKRAQQAGLAKLQECWLEHGHLMQKAPGEQPQAIPNR